MVCLCPTVTVRCHFYPYKGGESPETCHGLPSIRSHQCCESPMTAPTFIWWDRLGVIDYGLVRGFTIVTNCNERTKGSCHGTFQKATEYKLHWPVKQWRKAINLMKTSAQQSQDYPPNQLSTFWTSCDQEKCCMQQLQWYCRHQDSDISDWYCKKTVNLLVESRKELRQCFQWWLRCE